MKAVIFLSLIMPLTIFCMDFDAIFEAAIVKNSESPHQSEKSEFCFEKFFCDICNKTITQEDEINLLFHMENTHFICGWKNCYKQFQSAMQRRQHFMKTHATQDIIQTQKPLKKRKYLRNVSLKINN